MFYINRTLNPKPLNPKTLNPGFRAQIRFRPQALRPGFSDVVGLITIVTLFAIVNTCFVVTMVCYSCCQILVLSLIWFVIALHACFIVTMACYYCFAYLLFVTIVCYFCFKHLFGCYRGLLLLF